MYVMKGKQMTPGGRSSGLAGGDYSEALSVSPMVAVNGLSLGYSGDGTVVQALNNVSFDIPRGGTCAIIGPSGSGKSTLLYILSGLLAEYTGEVAVDGARVVRGRLQTALILQDYGLLPWKRVWGNASLGLDIRGLPAREKKERITEVLKDLGLYQMRDRYPAQLSGGQRQRVAIARALALEPDLLLMDEPFSSLDALTREALQSQLQDIWKKGNITIMLVTHSIEEAIFLGQRIIVLSPRPGRVVEIVDNPRAGQAGFRKTKDFYEMATRVRELLENENE